MKGADSAGPKAWYEDEKDGKISQNKAEVKDEVKNAKTMN